MRWEDRDVFEYGLDLILFSLATIIALLTLGMLAGLFSVTVFSIMPFMTLQVVGGGYHAKTHLRCFLITISGWLFAMVLYHFLPQWVIILFMAQGVLAVFSYAPIEHINALMSATKKKRMRHHARGICMALSLFAFALYYFQPIFASAIAVGIGMYGISANVAHRL